MRWKLISAGTLAVVIMHGCQAPAPSDEDTTMMEYERELDTWHAERIERLRAEDGWLSLVGLHWLQPGANRVGKRDGDAVRYEGFPVEFVGVITVHEDRITFRPERGVTVTGVPADGMLRTDADGPPTVLGVGSCRFHVIRRGERLGVRVKDLQAQRLTEFQGVARYPVDPAWRIEATFEPVEPGASVAVDSVIGVVSDEEVAGRARFVLDGVACNMVLLPGGDPHEFFVVFGDETNGQETYGGGRFLVASCADAGAPVVLDFNRAYNPPCAFSEFSTCPLPVEANQLPFVVRAGERAWTAR